MSQAQKERMARWAASVQAIARYAQLEGGFLALSREQFGGWKNVVHALPGELRVIPAVNAQGMKHWRHATAEELTAWVLDGCRGWGDDRPPLVALGSVYHSHHVPTVHVGGRDIDGRLRLLTTPLRREATSIRLRLRALLQFDNNIRTLCVVPRN